MTPPASGSWAGPSTPSTSATSWPRPRSPIASPWTGSSSAPRARPGTRPPDGRAGAELRYLMTVVATAADPRFHVTRVDIDRAGPTYTVDTLRDLQEEFAREHPGDTAEWFFITGADALADILELARPRPDRRRRAPRRRDPARATRSPTRACRPARVSLVEIPALAISSTDIRDAGAGRRAHPLPRPRGCRAPHRQARPLLRAGVLIGHLVSDQPQHRFPWRITAVVVVVVVAASVLAGVLLSRDRVARARRPPPRPRLVDAGPRRRFRWTTQRQVTLLLTVRDEDRAAVSTVLIGVGGDTGFVAELMLPRDLLLPTVPPMRLEQVDDPTGARHAGAAARDAAGRAGRRHRRPRPARLGRADRRHRVARGPVGGRGPRLVPARPRPGARRACPTTSETVGELLTGPRAPWRARR